MLKGTHAFGNLLGIPTTHPLLFHWYLLAYIAKHDSERFWMASSRAIVLEIMHIARLYKRDYDL